MRVSRIRGAVAVLLALVSVPIAVGVFDIAPASAATAASNIEAAYDYFVQQGLPPVAAAGLVGNLDYESDGVNPQASQCGGSEVAPPAGYCGVGIAQWTWGQNAQASRWADLVGLANSQGYPELTGATADPGQFPSLAIQLPFVWEELNGPYRPVLAEMEACAGETPVAAAIECATYAVQKDYEIPRNYTDEDPNPGCATPPGFCTRYADAEAIYAAHAPPGAPQALSVTAATSSTVSLSWQPSAGATGYEVLRNGRPVTTETTTAYTDRGLARGGSYTYSVEAASSNGSSGQSAPVSATTVPAVPSLWASARRLSYQGGYVTLAASAVGATSFDYAYTSSGAQPFNGWSPETPLTGQSASVALSIPPNQSGEPKTYRLSARGTNASGTSEPRTIAITVGGSPSPRVTARLTDRLATGMRYSPEGPGNALPFADGRRGVGLLGLIGQQVRSRR